MTASATIVFLIDIQNGFARNDLTPAEGGSLYVPGGENVGGPAADIIRNLSNSIIVLSQDFHPEGHISFASSHKGVDPFQDICLKKGDDGVFRAVAFAVKNEQGVTIGHKAVETDERGHVTQVLDKAADPALVSGSLEQKLWLDHCKQGSKSALFSDAVMGELPDALRGQLEKHEGGAVLQATDERGNRFFVVRKGMRPDLDSYGIATENDGVSVTTAPQLFAAIAKSLGDAGIKQANVSFGGLATNFCVEFSHNDIQKYLVPQLQAHGVASSVKLLSDISAGLDIPTANGDWPNLKAAPDRMGRFGTTVSDTGDVTRSALQGRAWALPQITLAA